jgi:hypothetical protein
MDGEVNLFPLYKVVFFCVQYGWKLELSEEVLVEAFHIDFAEILELFMG